MKKIKLELIPDLYMYIFFEEGTISRIFHISNRYSKANKTYLISYEPVQESKHIIHLDANNLDGYAMSKFLLSSGSKWIDPKEFVLNKYARNSSKECVLKLVLNILKNYGQLQNDYPLAPDKRNQKRNAL